MNNTPLPPDRQRGAQMARDRNPQQNGAALGAQQPSDLAATPALRPSWTLIAGLAALAATFVWIYWPTLLRLIVAWNVEPDYSHGYFVVPLALFFLWTRRDRMPQPQGPSWGGLALIAAGLAVHVLGSLYYLEPLNGWSMTIWLSGAAWLLGGRRFCLWCLPSALFLAVHGATPLFRGNDVSSAAAADCDRSKLLDFAIVGHAGMSAGNVISIDGTELEVARL